MENTEEKVDLKIDEKETKTVESPIEGDTVPTSEVIDKASGEKKAKINVKNTEIVKENQEQIEKIDWDKIVYEDEEKTIPLVTDDDIEVYSAITSEFVGDMDISSWVRMTKDEIVEYNTAIKNPPIDESDAKYRESLKETAKCSKELLALIQTQAKDLKKEFVENKIAETTIKAAVLKTLHDYIIDRYPIVENKEEIIKKYENDMTHFMYVVPIFRNLVDREIKRNNIDRLTPESLDGDAFDYTVAISTYVRKLDADQKENIDLANLISKDFEFMNFFVITILYSVYKYGDKDFVTNTIKNIDEKTLKSLDDTMNPSNSIENEAKYKEICENVFKIIDKFMNDKDYIENICNKMYPAISSDKTIKFYLESTENDVEKAFTEIVKNIPSIEGTRLGAWNRYYRAIRKLNIYFTFKQLLTLSKKEDVQPDELKAAIFNVIIKYSQYYYEHLFTNFISSFVDYLDNTINSKESRDIFFKSSMNYLNSIHAFGFKSSYNVEEKENIVPNIYSFAKKNLGKLYDSIVVDEKDDILLKDVDLAQVKIEYSKIVNDFIINSFN